ncbi:MAG: NAD(P)H-hydrate dehydratase [Candidatus Hydrogenedentes bacterium]|nr:NAD(P)H-hydrate dehydratase [Candidatus Hydrogenedentota bacterium]
MMRYINAEYVKSIIPRKSRFDHKGRYGHLFVIAGCRYYIGAGKLCAKAGLRAGTGLVTLGAPESVVGLMSSGLWEVIYFPLKDTGEGFISEDGVGMALDFSSDKEAVVIGPGVGKHDSTVRFIKRFIKEAKVPLVVDADGLNAVGRDVSIFNERYCGTVLTPHPGEMARLLECTVKEVQSNRLDFALEYAKKSNSVVVLKGHNTIVANPDGEYVVNPTGGYGLAKGGSGDVLSGLIGGLLAQGMSPYHSAVAGVWIHGMAGDLAEKELHPRSIGASDLLEFIHEVWKILDPEPYRNED